MRARAVPPQTCDRRSGISSPEPRQPSLASRPPVAAICCRSSSLEEGHDVSLRHRPVLAGAALVLALRCPLAAQQPADKPDYDAIYKIKEEGFSRSRVMELESWLTDVYGPRLTNSPNFRKAGDWAVSSSPSSASPTRSSNRGARSAAAGRTTSSTPRRPRPTPFPIIGYPKAWTQRHQRPGVG